MKSHIMHVADTLTTHKYGIRAGFVILILIICNGAYSQQPAPLRAITKIESGSLTISAPTQDSPGYISVQPRSFNNLDSFARFVQANLAAQIIKDSKGKIVAVKGKYIKHGEIIFREQNGAIFKSDDFILAYLGITSGKLRIAGHQINAESAAADKRALNKCFGTDCIIPCSEPACKEICTGPDCVMGMSWVSHVSVPYVGGYHSVGGGTYQSSGGYKRVPHSCCPRGAIVTLNGRRQCKEHRPGAWRYDQQLGRMVPISGQENPYIYTPLETCFSNVLRNELSIMITLLSSEGQLSQLSEGMQQFREQVSNNNKIEIGFWLITVGPFDLSAQWIDNVDGICSIHSGNGESFRTSDGNTGERNSLCQ